MINNEWFSIIDDTEFVLIKGLSISSKTGNYVLHIFPDEIKEIVYILNSILDNKNISKTEHYRVILRRINNKNITAEIIRSFMKGSLVVSEEDEIKSLISLLEEINK